MILRGWALAEQGALDEGIAQLHQGLTSLRRVGTEQRLPHDLAMLAEAYKRTGRAEEGLRMLGEARIAMYKSAERFYEAELYRLRGELLLQHALERDGARTARTDTSIVAEVEPIWMPRASSLLAEVEGCFHQAIAIACHQRAKSLELRAAISLGRLWQQQGKRAEAYKLLARVYGWFTEGFDTQDLREARTLIEMLQ
jgi:predicted ATPase